MGDTLTQAEAWARLVAATTEFGIAFARWDRAVKAYGEAKRREHVTSLSGGDVDE